MGEIDSNWSWGPAWTKLRSELDLLAWLFEEEKIIQRLYLESAVWALTGIGFSVDDFCKEVGIGNSSTQSPDDPKRPEEISLGGSGEGEIRHGDDGVGCRQEVRDTPT